MADIKFYDAYGSELHIGDAVRAVPDAPLIYLVHGLEYGIVTRLYGGAVEPSCHIDMQSFRGDVSRERYGTHPADCKYIVKIDGRGGDVTPSSSLLDCLSCI